MKAPARGPFTGTALERRAQALMAAHGVPAPEREAMVVPGRRWRFDFTWPDAKLALEIEGGTWSDGRHVRGSGYRADVEKYNAATLAGWRVIRATAEHLDAAYLIAWLRAGLGVR